MIRKTIVAGIFAGSLALPSIVAAHEAIEWNSTEITECDLAVVTVSRSDFIDCESYHPNSSTCESNAQARKRKLEEGVGAWCEAEVKQAKRQGCEKIRIFYHQHRGNEHESETGFVHDHWVDVHADVVCKDAPSAEEAESYAPEGYETGSYGQQDTASIPSPTCEEVSEGTGCWEEITYNPGCYMWDPWNTHAHISEWSGQCSGGIATGRGTITWHGPDHPGENTGELRDGKGYGHWVVRQHDGTVREGSYADGKPHGTWVVRYADGTCGRAQYSYGDYVSSSDC